MAGWRLKSLVVVVVAAVLAGAPWPVAAALPRPNPSPAPTVERLAFIFYYPWYKAAPNYVHWNFGGPDPSLNIESSSYPSMAAYDGTSATVLAQHMAWIKQAGLDALAVSWWGPNSPEDQNTPAVLNAAQA